MEYEDDQDAFHTRTNEDTGDPERGKVLMKQGGLPPANTVTFVVVGHAGVGKSTLANTLMAEKICKEGTSAKSVTKAVEKRVHQVSLEKGPSLLTVYDSPGFTGYGETDRIAADGLQQIEAEVDIILMCFDLLADGGRYVPLIHGTVMPKIVDAFGADAMKKKGIVILTKANLVSDRSKSTGVLASTLAKEWREEFQEDHKELAEVPVIAVGRGHFNSQGNMTHVSEIDSTTDWIDKLWNAMASQPSIKSKAHLSELMAVIGCDQLRRKTPPMYLRMRTFFEENISCSVVFGVCSTAVFIAALRVAGWTTADVTSKISNALFTLASVPRKWLASYVKPNVR